MPLAFGQIEQVTQVITSEGGKIELEICGYVEFPEAFLKEKVEIGFSCSDKEETYYPENFERIGSEDLFTPIGLNTLITIPASAIDSNATNPENTKVLKVRIPPTIMYEGTALAEIRYKLDNGTESFGFTNYDATMPTEVGLVASQVVSIELLELALMVDFYNPQTITISIVPVAPEVLIDTKTK